MINGTRRLPWLDRASLVAALAALSGHAMAQCPSPALFEIGGSPGPTCDGGGTSLPQTAVQAVARGRFISFESVPLVSGTPQVLSRLGLDRPVTAMHTEISGRIWATDGVTLYGINCSNAAAPSLLGQITIPNSFGLSRLRVKGNFVYLVNGLALYIVDISNPAAPVLRTAFNRPSGVTYFNDVEVVGSFAYLSIEEGTPQTNSMLVLDISDPLAPTEVRRVGNSNRQGVRLSKAPNLPGLYALTRNINGGALELWSLANAANPTLSVVNATLNIDLTFDELIASNTGILRLDSDAFPEQLRVYNPTTLAQVGASLSLDFNSWNQSLGVNSPSAFIPQSNGELIRVKYNSTSGFTSTPGVFTDVMPGDTTNVIRLNPAFSLLTSSTGDMWYILTPAAGAPVPAGHLKSGPSYYGFGACTALLGDGTLFATDYTGTSPNVTTRLIAYHVDGVGISVQGFLDIPGQVKGMDAGVDNNGVRHVYCTRLVAGSSTAHQLLTITASNLAAMSITSTFALTDGVYLPKFWPGSSFSQQPPRLIVGGNSIFAANDRTQILSVAAAGAPATVGVIPSPSDTILVPFGNSTTAWLTDVNVLKAYNLSNPTVPTLRSQTLLSTSTAYATDTAILSDFPFATGLGVLIGGRLIRLNVSNPDAPIITQIAPIGSPLTNSTRALAYDGSNLHFAGGKDGYLVYPLSFAAPPMEDPSHALSGLGTQGIVAVCSGQPITLTARFVANPAITSRRWERYNRTTRQFEPLLDGPTGTGSVVSGATTATLTITDPGPADATYYVAYASNSCGESRSATLVEARVGGYANCDASTTSPALSAADFVCFLTAFRDSFRVAYANCDGNSTSPQLSASDFVCFLGKFRTGCP